MSLANEDDYVRACLYGRYGTGKTTSLAHAAKLGKVHHLDAEQRLKGGPLRRLGVPIDRIEPHREVSYKALTDLVWKIKGEIHDDPGSVAAVGMDSATEVTKILIGQILDENVETAIRRAEKRGEEVTVNPFQVDIDWWGEMTEQFRRLLRLMRDLDCHLVFTAHERRDTDADGTVVYGPATTPAVQQDLMGYVDVLGHTEMDNGFYVARFAPGTKYQAKDTFGVLPPMMAQPTMDRIVAYVQEELTEETDPIQQEYLDAKRQRVESVRSAASAEVDGARRRRRTP